MSKFRTTCYAARSIITTYLFARMRVYIYVYVPLCLYVCVRKRKGRILVCHMYWCIHVHARKRCLGVREFGSRLNIRQLLSLQYAKSFSKKFHFTLLHSTPFSWWIHVVSVVLIMNIPANYVHRSCLWRAHTRTQEYRRKCDYLTNR